MDTHHRIFLMVKESLCLWKQRLSLNQWKPFPFPEIWFPRLIVVLVSSQEVAGVRKEKERLTAPARHPFVQLSIQD